MRWPGTGIYAARRRVGRIGAGSCTTIAATGAPPDLGHGPCPQLPPRMLRAIGFDRARRRWQWSRRFESRAPRSASPPVSRRRERALRAAPGTRRARRRHRRLPRCSTSVRSHLFLRESRTSMSCGGRQPCASSYASRSASVIGTVDAESLRHVGQESLRNRVPAARSLRCVVCSTASPDAVPL